jgi:hypothetical protein
MGFSSFVDDLGSEVYSFMCHSFMCLFGALQEGFTEDGTVIPRTEGEVKVFQECLASMSVLYSMFPVLVFGDLWTWLPLMW